MRSEAFDLLDEFVWREEFRDEDDGGYRCRWCEACIHGKERLRLLDADMHTETCTFRRAVKVVTDGRLA